MSKIFQNKIALITGASRGLGRAVAKNLAKNGAELILVSRTISALESLDDESKNDLYKKYDYVLDIPKDRDWPYSSTIRILDALRQNTTVIVGDTLVDKDIKNYTITIKEFLSNIQKKI